MRIPREEPDMMDAIERRLASFEASFEVHREDFAKHEKADERRESAVMRELGVVSTKIDGLSDQVGKIDARQWDETSKTHHLTPAESARRRPLDTRTLLALIGAIVVLGHVVSKLVDHLVR